MSFYSKLDKLRLEMELLQIAKQLSLKDKKIILLLEHIVQRSLAEYWADPSEPKTEEV